MSHNTLVSLRILEWVLLLLLQWRRWLWFSTFYLVVTCTYNCSPQVRNSSLCVLSWHSSWCSQPQPPHRCVIVAAHTCTYYTGVLWLQALLNVKLQSLNTLWRNSRLHKYGTKVLPFVITQHEMHIYMYTYIRPHTYVPVGSLTIYNPLPAQLQRAQPAPQYRGGTCSKWKQSPLHAQVWPTLTLMVHSAGSRVGSGGADCHAQTSHSASADRLQGPRDPDVSSPHSPWQRALAHGDGPLRHKMLVRDSFDYWL